MVKLDPAEVAKIQARFPNVKVSEVAARFENWARDKSDIRSPHGMLHSWVKKDDQERLEKAGRGLERESERNRSTGPDFATLVTSSHTPYGKFRIALLIEQVGSRLKPSEVAQRLFDETSEYPEIDKSEIAHLMTLGDDWKPVQKASSLPQERLSLESGVEPHADDDIPF